MGIYDIFSLSRPLDNPEPGDEQRGRIKAKKELWIFIDENIEEILNTYLDPSELAQEMINLVIYMLHPHYEGTELVREAQFVLKSLKIPQPQHYVKVFADSFERIIIRKLQGHYRREERKESE